MNKTVQLPLKFFFREFFVEENGTFSLILPHAKAILTAAWKTWSYKTKKDSYFNLLKGNTNLGRENGTFLVDERRSKTILLLLQQQQQQQRAHIFMTIQVPYCKSYVILVIICHEHQSKLILWIVCTDKVTRGVHQFIDHNVYVGNWVLEL